MSSKSRETGKYSQVVTIDGPAGTGKSQTAKQLARRLGVPCLDSGAVYRAIVLALQRAGITDVTDPGIPTLLSANPVSAVSRENRFQVFIGDEDVSELIRSEALGQAASRFATHGAVRYSVGELCRRFAADRGCVSEGRDLGSAVFPDAGLKIYLIASLDVRMKRRFKQLQAAGGTDSIEEVRAEMIERDDRDCNREIAPLCFPEGAIRIDTTYLSFEDQVEAIASLYYGGGRRRGSRFFRGVQFTTRLFFKGILGARIRGLANMPIGGAIVASNHVSNTDPPLLGCIVPGAIAFMAKEELFRNRFQRWLITSLYAIPIRRGRVDRTALKACMTQLNQAMPLIMFPQGTRVKEGSTGKIHTGVAWLARKTQVPVVPTRIRSNGLWRSFLRKDPIQVTFGEPIPPSPIESGRDDQDQAIRIMAAITRLSENS